MLTDLPRYIKNEQRRAGRERGVALLLVIFVVTLATVVVSSLTYSTYLAARSNAAVEESLFAEYLLKSAVNLSIALIKADKDTLTDFPKDPYGAFRKGIPIPPEILGVSVPNLRIMLEIVPENQKFPLPAIVNQGAGIADEPVRDMLVRLFQKLGFDNDTQEVATSGMFAGAFFDSKRLVANLIDYMDQDSKNYTAPNFPEGIEEDLPKGSFPNTTSIQDLAELSVIPGFTPHRMQIIENFVTIFDRQSKVNINFVLPTVLASLDSTITPDQIQKAIERQNSVEGFRNGTSDIPDTFPVASPEFNTMVTRWNSSYFKIVAKIDYGIHSFYSRAIVYRNGGGPDVTVRSLELF